MDEGAETTTMSCEICGAVFASPHALHQHQLDSHTSADDPSLRPPEVDR
jgi:hypothetical protein